MPDDSMTPRRDPLLTIPPAAVVPLILLAGIIVAAVVAVVHTSPAHRMGQLTTLEAQTRYLEELGADCSEARASQREASGSGETRYLEALGADCSAARERMRVATARGASLPRFVLTPCDTVRRVCVVLHAKYPRHLPQEFLPWCGALE